MRILTALLVAFSLVLPAAAQEHRLALAVQATGTVKWELAAMAALGIDARHGLALEVRDVADSRAGQIALQAGEADLILSDFVWVALQRQAGSDFTFVPHSLTVGGLMVDPAAGIATIADLKGKVLAVSGSPVDKSYVVLAAAYHQLTGGVLADDATTRFGAPPLINELLVSEQADAALNLWNWNSRARLAGKAELVSVARLLGDLGVSATPPLLGWAFSEGHAVARSADYAAFFDASFETKAALLRDDAVWEAIRPALNVGDDDALFARLRDDYRAGIITSYDPAGMQAASESFAVMARFGGADVVGDISALPAGTFYSGYKK